MTTKQEKRTWFEGYWAALDSFGIWDSGVQVIGCMKTPIKAIAKDQWRILFPDCVCENPFLECPGCVAWMGPK